MTKRWCLLARIVAFTLASLSILSGFDGTPALAKTDAGKPLVVSMGDSYSSGEGTEPFFYQWKGTDKYNEKDFLAHRSEIAWPALLTVNGTAMEHGTNWYFVAASGAETKHILDESQKKDWNRGKQKGHDELAVQKDVFASNDLCGKVDYVTLTMGGNDVGFSNIVRVGCTDDIPFLSEGSFEAELQKGIDTFDGTTRFKLKEVYSTIESEAGKQSTTIVAGYPHLFSPEGRLAYIKGSFTLKIAGIDASEADLINKAVDVFDAGIRNVVLEAKRDNLVFVDVRPSFIGHEADYINPIWNYPMDQDLKDEASSYSVHPNALGQEAYARAVQAKIDQLESARSAQKGSTDSQQNVAEDTQQNASENSGQNTEQAPESSTPKLIDSDITSDASMTLVFDVSGSMDDSSAMGGMTKLDSAKKQSMDFVSSVGGQGGAGGISIKLGVASFASDAQTDCELSADPARITESIDALSAYGGTNIYAGLAAGINQLAGQSGPKLMVFLSDGQSNEGGSYEDIISLAEEAHTEGIKIYTIGFGSSYDLDEDLLREIADITGGSYSHEDSSDISAATVGLFAAMMGAQLQATSEVLIENTGTVGQDATTDVGTFDVDQSGDLTAYLYWPGSILDMQLTDPDGVLVDESYEGYTVDTTSIPTAITIKNAKKGTWHMSVFGREVSMAAEPFYAVAAFTEMAEEVVAAVGGGGYTNSGNGLFFLLIAMAIAGIAGVFAMSARRG